MHNDNGALVEFVGKLAEAILVKNLMLGSSENVSYEFRRLFHAMDWDIDEVLASLKYSKKKN